MSAPRDELLRRVGEHLATIYDGVRPADELPGLAAHLLTAMRLDDVAEHPPCHRNNWSERDAVLITYGDSLLADGEQPLSTLHRFLNSYCTPAINSVHILPFFPYSSDDGFSVIDFSQVNQGLGDWGDIEAIADDYRLMADLVINHCSARSRWFDNFVKQRDPGRDYFFTASPEQDLSEVVRPRATPLLREVETTDGPRHVWCTFSHDQIDFDFRNPAVLCEFVSIIRQYLDHGVRIFRLDAVAFLWKIPGTSCLNLEQTHEAVRLLRSLIEHAQPDAVIITETNIPNRQNLTYFGNANEAHCIYNFSLPPLLVNTLITGNCCYLKQWQMSMPPAQNGTAYFNFVASHDGIGLRPAEGLLGDDELATLVDTMASFGGRISSRALPSGEQKPYEINIALVDALKGTTAGPDRWQIQRFLSAHAIMLALEGIPGLYLHSLLGTENDLQRVEHTSHNRAINRHQWNYGELQRRLKDTQSLNSQIMVGMLHLLRVRTAQAAFHPNATQFTLHLGDEIFGFWRQSMDRSQSIFCINNVTDQTRSLRLADINLIGTEHWVDLIGGGHFRDHGEVLALQPYQSLWISNRWEPERYPE